ncbi:MAG: hypothetical protein QGG40_09825, partial [Myxococcota bacterium]|nr:hypothetical protein [Myxococcota bacterium]
MSDITSANFDSLHGRDYAEEKQVADDESEAKKAMEIRRAARIRSSGIELVIRMSTLMRTARMHSLDNRTTQVQFEAFQASTRRALDLVDPVQLVYYEGAFFLDERRLRPKATTREVVKDLGRLWTNRQVGGVQFEASVTDEDLHHFVEAFLEAEEGELGRQLLASALEDRGVSGILLSPMKFMGKRKQREAQRGPKAALDLYADLLDGLPELYGLKRGSGSNEPEPAGSATGGTGHGTESGGTGSGSGTGGTGTGSGTGGTGSGSGTGGTGSGSGTGGTGTTGMGGTGTGPGDSGSGTGSGSGGGSGDAGPGGLEGTGGGDGTGGPGGDGTGDSEGGGGDGAGDTQEDGEPPEVLAGMAMTGVAALLHAAAHQGAHDPAAAAALARRTTHMVHRMVEAAEADLYGFLSLTTIHSIGDFALTHSVNVSILATALGRRLRLTRSQLSELASCALFHNVGQTVLAPEVLHKPDRLSPDERHSLELHPLTGFRHILDTQGVNPKTIRRAIVALEHHMSFDGRGGYPFLQGWKPHLYSRMVAICDAYEALVSPRPFRDAFQPDIAIKLLQRQSGSRFDPVLLRLFMDMVGKWPVGSLVELDDGKLGIVVAPGTGRHRWARPRVMLVRDAMGRDLEPEVVELSTRHDRRKAYRATIVRTHDPNTTGLSVARLL